MVDQGTKIVRITSIDKAKECLPSSSMIWYKIGEVYLVRETTCSSVQYRAVEKHDCDPNLIYKDDTKEIVPPGINIMEVL